MSLKKLSSTCSFGTFLEEALRDRLVSGLHKKMMKAQKMLLTVRGLSFREAKEKCIAEEMAAKATQDYLGEEVISLLVLGIGQRYRKINRLAYPGGILVTVDVVVVLITNQKIVDLEMQFVMHVIKEAILGLCVIILEILVSLG